MSNLFKVNNKDTRTTSLTLFLALNRFHTLFSKTVFILGHCLLTDAEIKVSENRLDFAPIQRKINEPEHKQDFNDFFTGMSLK